MRIPQPPWRHGFRFPLLVRTPGFHTGRHLLRVEGPEALPGAVAELPGKELTVIEFLNARGADGKVRKYRVMLIGGEIYPLHVAISSDWKIHYFTAEMAERADHRAEDAEFLQNMPEVLGPRAMQAGRDSSHARPGLWRHRFRLECHGRAAALRDECHDGGESARAGRAVGLPPPCRGEDLRRRPPDADKWGRLAASGGLVGRHQGHNGARRP
jgi:hypothetical protein